MLHCPLGNMYVVVGVMSHYAASCETNAFFPAVLVGNAAQKWWVDPGLLS